MRNSATTAYHFELRFAPGSRVEAYSPTSWGAGRGRTEADAPECAQNQPRYFPTSNTTAIVAGTSKLVSFSQNSIGAIGCPPCSKPTYDSAMDILPNSHNISRLKHSCCWKKRRGLGVPRQIRPMHWNNEKELFSEHHALGNTLKIIDNDEYPLKKMSNDGKPSTYRHITGWSKNNASNNQTL